MRCANIEPLLSEYADGIAGERERRIVERHIQLCATCHDNVLFGRQIGQQLMRLSLLPLGINDRAPRLQQQLAQRLTRRGLRKLGRALTIISLLLLGATLAWLLYLLVVGDILFA